MSVSNATATSWFAPEELPALADFWHVYDGAYDEIQRALVPPLMEHPTFGPIIAAIPKDVQEKQRVESRQRLARAIEHGDWNEYDVDLRKQGAMYAALGVTFRDWYDVVRLFGAYLLPKLVDAFGGDLPRMSRALRAMQEFVDHVMSVIGESYIAAKERTLRTTQERLAITLDSIGDAVIATDANGNVERLNPVAEWLTGWTLAECKGKPLDDVFEVVNETTGVPVPSPVERVLRTGLVVGLANHTALVRRDGIRLPIADSAAPIRALDGSIEGVVLVFRDVSDERAAEERLATQRAHTAELELQSRRVREASRMKSEFLANMSHELRTPLNAIIGFAELLHDGRVGDVEPQQKEFLGDILTSGRHLLQLINDVLNLSKVEAGKMEFHPEPLDLEKLVGEVTSILRAAAASKRVTVSTQVSRELGEVVLDAARLKQVFYNYLSNALKFTPEGGEVSICVEPELPAALRITVADTGIGIDPADVPRLFVEFQQLEGGAAKKHGGTGLGLALTRRLVEAQGGSVGVASEPARGSRFHAILPCRTGGGLLQARSIHPPLARAGAPLVLVVDDDPRDQQAIVATLTAAGYGVEIAATGRQAMAMAGERVYDAITLDLILPDTSGLDVLQAIRSESRNRQVPVVLITVVAEQVAAGFMVSDVLPKPHEGKALLAALRRAGVVPKEGVVMVVDDDPAALKLMSATLRQLEYPHACHLDGHSALHAIEQRRPLAIILDLLMPGMDGFEFLTRLRNNPAHRDIPVLVWTIKDLSRDEADALRASVEVVIRKGTGATELVAELDAYLARPTLMSEAPA